MGERRGQLGLERGDELAARGGGRVRGARTADEDDAGGESVGARAEHAVAELSPHRPSAADGESSADHRVEEGLPASARGALVAFRSRTA